MESTIYPLNNWQVMEMTPSQNSVMRMIDEFDPSPNDLRFH